MNFRKKIKRFMNKRNLNPLNNRKKVGVILFATSIGLFFLFAGRLAYIVIGGHVHGVSLEEKVRDLYTDTKAVAAKRGAIYDRNGETIAENSMTYKLIAILSDTYISGKEKLYAQQEDFTTLASILNQYAGIPTEDALKSLQSGVNSDGSTQYQVEFGNKGRNLSLETKQNIESAMKAANVKGLYFEDQSDRIYPNGIFSSHLIGYAAPDNEKKQDDLVGHLGIESAYNKVLSGKNGSIKYQKNAYGNPLPGTVAEETPATDGYDIYTTLDTRLQSYLETLMDQVYDTYDPENLTAVLMKANTGEIVSMAQRPTFNPETLEGLDGENAVWRNFLVQDSYEPGSTMKIATVASAIDEGVFNPNEGYQSGELQIEDGTIKDWDLGGKGWLTMRQAFSWSSNTGMARLEQKMQAAWPEHLKRFGFGTSTYSGLEEETNGQLPTNNVVDEAMSAYGQAIGVNQLQMLRMFSAVANGGKMLQPHYISKIVDPKTGKETVVQPQVVGQPMSENAASTVLTYMRDVVESEDYGTAYGIYSLPGHTISAKTGTAEIAKENSAGYIQGNYIYSVVLVYPSEKPEYILYLTTKEPQNYNKSMLAEIANPFMKRSMDLLSTETETTDTSTTTVKVADYDDQDVSKAAVAARRALLNPIVLGSGDKVTKQSIKADESIDPNTRLMLLTEGTVKMPDTTGWTKSELEAFGKLLDIEVEINGEGTCVQQSVKVDTELTNDSISFTLG